MFCCSKKTNRVSPKEIKPKSILKNNKDIKFNIKQKRIKRKSIYPKHLEIQKNREELEEKHRERDAFTKKFCSEIIACGACQENFRIGDNALQINCGSCNQFFHCSIAGACVGPNCSIILDGKKESLKYCMGCVNPYLRINVMDNGQALCKTCENDPLTDKIHLRV